MARGVELSGDTLIAYGLGNFLHLGTQDMRRFDICRDFGLLLRAGLVKRGGAFEVETVEAVPLTKMHVAPEPMTGEAGRLRVEVLNHLGTKLGEEGVAVCSAGGWFGALVRGGRRRCALQGLDGAGGFSAGGGDCGGLREAGEEGEFVGFFLALGEPLRLFPPLSSSRRKPGSMCGGGV